MYKVHNAHDGSNQFSTACIHLVSYNIRTNEVHASLVYTASPFTDSTIFPQTTESIPVKEMHGLLLCASNMIKIVGGFNECNIPLSGCNIGVDAVSQIVALRSSPCHSKSRMKKYYANINIHLYKLAQLTGQFKETLCCG